MHGGDSFDEHRIAGERIDRDKGTQRLSGLEAKGGAAQLRVEDHVAFHLAEVNGGAHEHKQSDQILVGEHAQLERERACGAACAVVVDASEQIVGGGVGVIAGAHLGAQPVGRVDRIGDLIGAHRVQPGAVEQVDGRLWHGCAGRARARQHDAERIDVGRREVAVEQIEVGIGGEYGGQSVVE